MSDEESMQPPQPKYDYLDAGLGQGNELPDALGGGATQTALAWLGLGVDPHGVELASEWLARVTEAIPDDPECDGDPERPASDDVDRSEALGQEVDSLLAEAAGEMGLPEVIQAILAAASKSLVDKRSLAAFAVHLLDIAERMALEVFVPELPALTAKSDRSGAAARQVGTARHLRG